MTESAELVLWHTLRRYSLKSEAWINQFETIVHQPVAKERYKNKHDFSMPILTEKTRPRNLLSDCSPNQHFILF